MKQYILPLILIFVVSCKDKNISVDASSINEVTLIPFSNQSLLIDKEIELWTDSIRKKIINEVNTLSFDSVTIDTSANYINQFYYFKGQKVKTIGLTKDRKDTVGFYYESPNSEFNANGETCPKTNTELIEKGGLHTYRGLKYKGKHIGLATYLHCDHSTFEKGMYYIGKRIGTWVTFDLNTNKITTKEYGQKELIKKLRETAANTRL